MPNDESLPDSGGHYYDEDNGFVAVARRNVERAKDALISGEIGPTIAAGGIGYVVGRALTN